MRDRPGLAPHPTRPAQATPLPSVSLVIGTRNRPALLADTVRSILAGDEVPAEIVIIDQSDEPQTDVAALAREYDCEIQYSWTPTRGSGRARNLGIQAAQHAILAFCDDDMLAPPTWFGALIRALVAAGPDTVVTGQVLAADEEQPGGFAPSLKVDETPALYEGRVGQDVLWSGNMALYRSAVEVVGLFDERFGAGAHFPAAEDNDLGFRLLEAGYRILYVPSAILYHRSWRASDDYGQLRWNYGRGQGAFFAKHLSVRDWHMLSRLITNVRTHLLGFASRVRRQRRLAYGDALYTAGLFAGVGEWLLTQRLRPWLRQKKKAQRDRHELYGTACSSWTYPAWRVYDRLRWGPLGRYMSLARRIPGWTRDDEAVALAYASHSLPDHARIVELGSFLGRSAVLLAGGRKLRGSGHLHCIDPFDASGDAFSAPVYLTIAGALRTSLRQCFEKNIRRAGLSEWVTVHQGYAEEIGAAWTQPIDLLFMDGDHSYAAVMRAYAVWAPWLKPGGWLAIHNSRAGSYHQDHDGHRRLVEEKIHPPHYTDIFCIRTTTFARKSAT